MAAYYNEIDVRAAAWLRELIRQGHIAPGDVDERSIEDVRPSELAGYTQCHFFAGIGGWSLALRMAGWPDDRAVWTGSCPCQPFSAAGKGGGFADERHLWPAWHHLIRVNRPGVIFGEQVASPAGLNWFALVHADLEGEEYSTCAVDICAASFGAPHIRQRLYWVADNNNTRRLKHTQRDCEPLSRSEESPPRSYAGGRSEFDWLAYSSSPRLEVLGEQQARGQRPAVERSGTPWDTVEWIHCRDGKARPIEPGTFPLASRVSGRVGLLRGYGNAIVPQLAAEFIKATGLA